MRFKLVHHRWNPKLLCMESIIVTKIEHYPRYNTPNCYQQILSMNDIREWWYQRMVSVDDICVWYMCCVIRWMWYSYCAMDSRIWYSIEALLDPGGPVNWYLPIKITSQITGRYCRHDSATCAASLLPWQLPSPWISPSTSGSNSQLANVAILLPLDVTNIQIWGI